MTDKKSLLVMFEGDQDVVEKALLNYAVNNGWTEASQETKEDYIAKLLWSIIIEGATNEMFPENTHEKEDVLKTMEKVNSNGI